MQIKIMRCRVAVLFALAISSMTYAQDTPPVETDARLHSNGNGWKLNQAKVVDQSLPRVLLMGDSILAGYQKHVIEGLKNKAYIDAWVQPYHQGHLSGTYLTSMIKEVLAKGPYAVIVFIAVFKKVDTTACNHNGETSPLRLVP